MLSVLDRHIKAWHVWAANALAVLWFVGITLAGRIALPDVALFRCPVGFCAGGYTPEELGDMLGNMGEEGRNFLRDTLLPLDLVLPALLLFALSISYVWFSRSGDSNAVSLSAGARYTLLAVPVLYGVADYGENWAVAEMLRAYPEIDDDLAKMASSLTAAKSQLIAASVGIAFALAFAAWGAARSRSGSDQPPRAR
jgi:hypothetical protein